MSISLGEKLRIRAMVYTAGEPIPYFWPMRSFIHHNPLHGLEDLPFADAVEAGQRLFRARTFLTRRVYQDYLRDGSVDVDTLAAGVARFLADRPGAPGIDLQARLMALLTAPADAADGVPGGGLARGDAVHAALHGERPDAADAMPRVAGRLHAELSHGRPLYEAADSLYGTKIGQELDELVIKSCLDFFDEGQSVWGMPGREQGFFNAWRALARRDARLSLRGLHVKRLLSNDDCPEAVIVHVLEVLQIPEAQWVAYFTRELARLHGWAGFVRWRASAPQYAWGRLYPADLVDYLAVRLTLALALLSERGPKDLPRSVPALSAQIETRTGEMFLRHELYSGGVLPAMARRIEQALARGRDSAIRGVFDAYLPAKVADQASRQVQRLRQLTGDTAALRALSPAQLDDLLDTLDAFERHEGMLWLRAMEAAAITRLLENVSLAPVQARDKRPFVQALFCIDTRSERIRRHLEGVGDYQTYGIAGFFGVPVSFIELGKGSETHLCPVLLTPKNLVLEMTASVPTGEALTALEKVTHELKESVLTPFVTVEAIGLLFGFDMIGKTLAPRSYNRWRRQLRQGKPSTHLLLDKLSREQADSVVRAVQRAVIAKAIEHEFKLAPEHVTDDMVRALREAAMGHQPDNAASQLLPGLDRKAEQAFVERLRTEYRINPAFAQLQLERLGRIGFSLDEQTRFVSQALQSIGLTGDFSRFVLLVGHGSTSENNPFESALDCGACGGNHGLVSARVLAQMANKPQVRRRLATQGIAIADDVWFVPALHDTTTDDITLVDLELLPPSHLVYLDRLKTGLIAAARLCAQERVPTLTIDQQPLDAAAAYFGARRNAMDWSQVRPEWGLSRNAYFVIGRRALTEQFALDGRAFLHSYDYRVDSKLRLLDNILTGPLVVGQWINMEHYFSTTDNERFGSGSKVYHNVAGRFGVMTGNLGDLRTGLPAQTVLDKGEPFHQPMRLITLIEAPFEHARRAVEGVVAVKRLVRNGWIRMIVLDPETSLVHIFAAGEWHSQSKAGFGADEELKRIGAI